VYYKDVTDTAKLAFFRLTERDKDSGLLGYGIMSLGE
jgi:hypothetical protein